ncbi:ankyrin [Coniochaeta ligniaria NRRL 30616]|uniref:Ankyrin n=1 Tax=Coniochaeta ligniaria NRRL 30616 TaxID=1408157 RepID=A0A1J7JT88_9PEZI|nr:ankyrin [Coniochaeta ligniaria NRRL 30616]
MLLADERVDAACRSQNGWTALHWAACSGNRAVVMYGVEREQEEPGKPDTDTETSPKERLSMSGGEAKGHEETVALLLKAGVPADSRTEDGRTALHWAAASGNMNIIRLLRDHGAAVGCLDVNGKLPWQFAVENGAGADVVAVLFLRRELL